MGHLGRRIGKHKNNPIQRNLADERGPNCRQIATLLQIPAAFSPKETPQCSQASVLLHSKRSKKHTNSIWEYKSSTSLVISFIAKSARIHIAFPAQILMKEHPELPLPRGKTAHKPCSTRHMSMGMLRITLTPGPSVNSRISCSFKVPGAKSPK